MPLFKPNRRDFLKTSALAGAALTVPELIPTASGSIANTSYFDLTQSSTEYVRNLHQHDNSHAMQSFAWNSADWLYVLETKNDANGDMTLSRYDSSLTAQGYMVLSGAGHGVAMGIDRWASPNYYWTESESYDNGGGGRGRKLQRFTFSNGATITHSDAEVFDPTIHLEGHTCYNVTCSIDPTYKRIGVRYCKNADGSGGLWFNIYNLDDFNNHNYIPLITSFKIPSAPSGAGTAQGWCLYGSWLYFSYGTKESTCPGTQASAAAGGSMVGRLNINSPTSIIGYDSQVGYTLCQREMEGVGIRLVGGQPRLHIGCSGNNDGSSNHYVSMYYKTAMI
ncbi:MAG: twin-arginine translocation signal domain-containing protein [Acidobacteria bacterium]|nr:twin-arginine translocation signal domain-containing protein [Acidobacteriota bacterium]